MNKLSIPASFTPIRVMCSSRLDPVLILTAFLRGADGVLVAGCHPGDCHYDTGNYYTRRRQVLLKKRDREPGAGTGEAPAFLGIGLRGEKVR